MKVLVIEDSAEQRVILAHWLKQLGYEVILASGGAEGIDLFNTTRPQIVLLDVMMPDVDGLETARRIRALGGPWVPIIFVSANSDPRDIGDAIDAGGDDYLVKPVSKIVLAAKLLAMRRIIDMKIVMASVLPAFVDQELQRLSELDEQTGLSNHYGLDRGLAREYARCGRAAQPISAIVAQVDDWPARNMDCGHWLKKLSVIFKTHIARSPDLLAHLGDGRFCAVLPDTPLTGALHLADKINRSVVESHPAVEPGKPPLRFGVAMRVPEFDRDHKSLLDAAEQALNHARRGQAISVNEEQAPNIHLTPRELECLQWCAQGKSTWDIGKLLEISEAAVNFHMANIRAKFGVGTRQQAVTRAVRMGLLPNP